MKGSIQSDTVLQKAEWQSLLFASQPKRSELLKLKQTWPCRKIFIRVHRNHSFELVATAMVPYLAFGDFEGVFTYSDYDDSLTFNISGNADVEVIWLDFKRYRSQFDVQELSRWLKERLHHLRTLSRAPLLIMDWDSNEEPAKVFNKDWEEYARTIPDALWCNRASLVSQLGKHYFDERVSSYSGTRLSDAACILIARELACHWIPAMITSPIKAIVLDLDNTLYKGVLEEDAVEGLELTAGHVQLQQYLVELRRKGIFLALISKNEKIAVEKLFSIRKEFPLTLEDFSSLIVSWDEKAIGIEHIANALRIGIDDLVFVDDNPGELASVANRFSRIHAIYAGCDPSLTTRALEYYPGLWRRSIGTADALRITDIKANDQRNKLMNEIPDPEEYLRSLKVCLTFTIHPRSQLARLHELSQKTNQFNVSLKRLSEQELIDRFGSDEYSIVSIHLKDRLSESGIIGLIVGHRIHNNLVVEELCLSCRALGRNLENVILREGLRLMLEKMPATDITIEHRPGPRNNPARMWLETVAQGALTQVEGNIRIPKSFWQTTQTYPIEIKVVSSDET
jgi:FkbH-like protein